MHYVKQIILMMFLFQTLSCSASSGNPDFQGYWAQFRAASLSNDYATLVNLTKLPLEVKDVVDENSIVTYGKNDLSKIFPKLMSQTVYVPKGDDLLETTMTEIVKKKEKVT